MQESIAFLVRVQCRRKESSRSLSHLLMSFLFCFLLHSCCIIVSTVGWTWWDRSLILWTYLPSVLCHCRLGHLTRKNPSLIWPNVFGETLSLTRSINQPSVRRVSRPHRSSWCVLNFDSFDSFFHQKSTQCAARLEFPRIVHEQINVVVFVWLQFPTYLVRTLLASITPKADATTRHEIPFF